MRCGKLVVMLALCLYCAGVRAADPTVDQASTLRTMLGGNGSLLPGVPSQGGVLGTFKSSMMAAAAPISAGLSQMHDALKAQYEAVTGQLETVVAAAEAEFCTPPTFTPSAKKPAKFVGSSFTVNFDLGGCAFNQTTWMEEGRKVLNCTEPSITYSKAPANFSSKYHTAPSFVSKTCKVTKTFGESVEKVLFVFDGTQAPDMTSLIAKITEEVKNVMGTISSSATNIFNTTKNNRTGGSSGGLW